MIPASARPTTSSRIRGNRSGHSATAGTHGSRESTAVPAARPSRRSMSFVRAGAVLSTVAASALVLSAAPAQAATAPVIQDTKADSFALGVAKTKDFVLAAQVTGATSVTVRSDRTLADSCDSWSSTLHKHDATVFGDVFDAPPHMFAAHGGNGCAGTWRATFTAKGAGGQDTATR